MYRTGLLCAVVWWLRADGRGHKVTPVYCLGMLASVGWVALIPYHLLKTRGLRGVVALLGVLGAFAAAQLVAVIAYLIFSAVG